MCVYLSNTITRFDFREAGRREEDGTTGRLPGDKGRKGRLGKRGGGEGGRGGVR